MLRHLEDVDLQAAYREIEHIWPDFQAMRRAKAIWQAANQNRERSIDEDGIPDQSVASKPWPHEARLESLRTEIRRIVR